MNRWILVLLALIMLTWGCAHAPSTSRVHEKIDDYDDVDEFVVWLENQPGITEVNVNKDLFLTSSPPKVIVKYSANGQMNELAIAVEPDKKLRLVQSQ